MANVEEVAISTNTGWKSGFRVGLAVAGWIAVSIYVIGETHDIRARIAFLLTGPVPIIATSIALACPGAIAVLVVGRRSLGALFGVVSASLAVTIVMAGNVMSGLPDTTSLGSKVVVAVCATIALGFALVLERRSLSGAG